jgi:hypothetical protein
MNRNVTIAVLLLLGTTTAYSQADVEGPNCDGIVTRFGRSLTLEPRHGEVCSPKWVTDLNSKFAQQILRACPMKSHCHVEGVYSNHGIESVSLVQRR